MLNLNDMNNNKNVIQEGPQFPLRSSSLPSICLSKACSCDTEVCSSGSVAQQTPGAGKCEQRKKISRIRIKVNNIKSNSSGVYNKKASNYL